MHNLIIYFFFRRCQQHTNVILSIHDDPAWIIAPFEILLDEESNDYSLRDAIESIAHHYNSQYPGDIVVSMPYPDKHTVV